MNFIICNLCPSACFEKYGTKVKLVVLIKKIILYLVERERESSTCVLLVVLVNSIIVAVKIGVIENALETAFEITFASCC